MRFTFSAPSRCRASVRDGLDDLLVVVAVERRKLADLGGRTPDVVLWEEPFEIANGAAEPSVSRRTADCLVERVVRRTHPAVERRVPVAVDLTVERMRDRFLRPADLRKVLARPANGGQLAGKAL